MEIETNNKKKIISLESKITYRLGKYNPVEQYWSRSNCIVSYSASPANVWLEKKRR